MRTRRGGCLLLALMFTGCGHAGVQESSGLAASARYPDSVWTINDSGSDDDQMLFLLDGKGRRLAQTKVAAENEDWEDLAAFELGGKPYLLIADTGDNDRERVDYFLHAVREPAKGTKKVAVAWTVRFRFQDGRHDVEAIAVDSTTRTVLLIAKEPEGPIYRVPLLPRRGGTVVAERVGRLARLPGAGIVSFLRHPLLAWYAGRVTGFDLSPDGDFAAVSTYESAYVWRRRPREDWARVLSRPPCRIPLDAIRQYEGIAFVEGALVVSRERADTLHLVSANRWRHLEVGGDCAAKKAG